MNRFFLILLFILSSFAIRAEYMVVDVHEIGIRPNPSVNGQFIALLPRGTEIEVTEINGRWATVNYKGEERYVEAAHLAPSPREIEAGTVAQWRIPGPNQQAADDFGWYFSTDRIMETLPTIEILHNKLPFDPDRCFNIAVALLFSSWIGMFFISSRIVYGNLWFWLIYAVSIIIAVCELVYLLGSDDPLGYCDINNVGFFKALLYVGLSGLALYQQLALFSTVMFTTQRDRDFHVGASWGIKLMMLIVIYFIICVFCRHFFYTYFPPYITYIALGFLCIPVVAIIWQGCMNKDFVTMVVLLPFYIIMCATTLCIYCLIGIAVALLSVILFVVTLFLNSGTYEVKYKGVWYYCDYDTWKTGMDFGLWDDHRLV